MFRLGPARKGQRQAVWTRFSASLRETQSGCTQTDDGSALLPPKLDPNVNLSAGQVSEFDIKLDFVWDTVCDDIPVLIAQLESPVPPDAG